MKKSILNLGKVLSKKEQRTINGGNDPNGIIEPYEHYECEMCTDGHLCYYDSFGDGFCTAKSYD